MGPVYGVWCPYLKYDAHKKCLEYDTIILASTKGYFDLNNKKQIALRLKSGVLLDLKLGAGIVYPYSSGWFNSSPPGQNGSHFENDIFTCIFVNEKFCILIETSSKFVPKGPIDNNPALV